MLDFVTTKMDSLQAMSAEAQLQNEDTKLLFKKLRGSHKKICGAAIAY